MLRAQILVAVLGLFLLSLVAAPPTNAECRSAASCYMPTDYYSEQTDGPYDPCYNDISWTFKFRRTSQTSGTCFIQWKITNQQGGAIISRNYDSRDYPAEQWQYFDGDDSLGPSNWHKLHLLKMPLYNSGYFEYMEIHVNYVAGDPTRP